MGSQAGNPPASIETKNYEYMCKNKRRKQHQHGNQKVISRKHLMLGMLGKPGCSTQCTEHMTKCCKASHYCTQNRQLNLLMRGLWFMQLGWQAHFKIFRHGTGMEAQPDRNYCNSQSEPIFMDAHHSMQDDTARAPGTMPVWRNMGVTRRGCCSASCKFSTFRMSLDSSRSRCCMALFSRWQRAMKCTSPQQAMMVDRLSKGTSVVARGVRRLTT
mmetsp:Transcript_7470/g.19915  ORF Transcript_7470/g.19915 Transcript_7470/m.19915 type:complete len:215 (+) Transcript_7470:334-978(+)|eukprot:365627-Pelagomonas_calceolata.AAC.8